jgi:prepilin-type N-terminal cleavage/methylation domain-containing protein
MHKSKKCRGSTVRANTGFTLFELVVVLCILAILAEVLLQRISGTAAIAEKVAMENTVNQINTALLFEFANNVIRNTREKIPAMTEKNPMEWLAQYPSNYVGGFAVSPSTADTQGYWFYDTTEHLLVYTVRRGDDFQPDSEGLKRVRYKVKILYDSEESKGMVGVVLSPVEPYKWF